MSDNNNTKKIVFHNFEEITRFVDQFEASRLQKLSELKEEDAKQLKDLILSLTKLVLDRAKAGAGDERKNWISYLNSQVRKPEVGKDIGAVLVFIQNTLFVYENLLDENDTSLLAEYAGQMLNLSMLHDRLKRSNSNQPLAERAIKSLPLAQTPQQLETLNAVIDKEAVYQFAQRNFETAAKYHTTIFEARKAILENSDFTAAHPDAVSALKYAQIKTIGNLMTTTFEQNQTDETLAWFETANRYAEDPDTAAKLDAPLARCIRGGQYLTAASVYNRLRDRDSEKSAAQTALELLQITDSNEKNPAQTAILRRRAEQILTLNEEDTWYYTSDEYRNEVTQALSNANACVKFVSENKVSLNESKLVSSARDLEEAITRLEELHAIDLMVTPFQYYRFCQYCGDFNRLAKNLPSITKYWFQKTADFLTELEADGIAFDHNDLAINLYFLSDLEKDKNPEEAISMLLRCIGISEDLLKDNKLRDQNNLAAACQNLAILYQKQGNTENARSYAKYAYDIWYALVHEENRTALAKNLEACEKLVNAL